MKQKFKAKYYYIRIRLLQRKLIRHNLKYLKFYVLCITKIGNPKNEEQKEMLHRAFKEYDKTLQSLTKEIDQYRFFLSKKF